MLGLGIGEILLIAAVLLVVVGPEGLPQVFRTLGRIYGQLRRASDEMRRAFVLEADRQDAETRMEDLAARRKKAEEVRKKAMTEAGSGTVAQTDRLPVPKAAPAPPEVPSGLPEGVSLEDWARMPPSVRERMLQADRTPREAPAVDEEPS